MQTNLEKLKTAFAEVLPLPADIDHSIIEYGKTDGWDSVAHMALVARIETEFEIMLETGDVVDLSSFPKAMEIVGRYGVAFE